jgi:release factor glutamine methyltransferase
MTIHQWLSNATSSLQAAGIPSARLDAELILAHVLKKDRTWLIAHASDTLPVDEDSAFPAERAKTNEQLAASASETTGGVERANQLVRKRAQRIPLGYLLGHKEFYGRDFIVNEQVLIPRPETEAMIESLQRIASQKDGALLDVGTGSGCIAITAKLELPKLTVIAADISDPALDIAKLNAIKLGADVTFISSDLLSSIDGTFDYILSNLPYVDPEWERSPETNYEPPLALFAKDHGLALINRLITDAPKHLADNGYFLLEADPEQHESIKKTGATHGLRLVETNDYTVVLQKA